MDADPFQNPLLAAADIQFLQKPVRKDSLPDENDLNPVKIQHILYELPSDDHILDLSDPFIYVDDMGIPRKL